MKSIQLNTTTPQDIKGFFWSNKILYPFKKTVVKKHFTITTTGFCHIWYPINHPLTV